MTRYTIGVDMDGTNTHIDLVNELSEWPQGDAAILGAVSLPYITD